MTVAVFSLCVACRKPGQIFRSTHSYRCCDAEGTHLTVTVEMVTSRRLHDWETRAAQTVFADAIDYNRVRVHEGAVWANTVDNWARRLRALSPRPAKQHNAIALGFHCFFPVKRLHSVVQMREVSVASMAWMLHELAHVWQFQHMGWRYLLLALVAHLREGVRVYDFGGEAGLRCCRRQGWKLQSFNLEQQAFILEHAYRLLIAGQFNSIWHAYLDDVD